MFLEAVDLGPAVVAIGVALAAVHMRDVELLRANPDFLNLDGVDAVDQVVQGFCPVVGPLHCLSIQVDVLDGTILGNHLQTNLDGEGLAGGIGRMHPNVGAHSRLDRVDNVGVGGGDGLNGGCGSGGGGLDGSSSLRGLSSAGTQRQNQGGSDDDQDRFLHGGDPPITIALEGYAAYLQKK